jgi:alpha-tubulin suppressor-like RCC1 family protein
MPYQRTYSRAPSWRPVHWRIAAGGLVVAAAAAGIVAGATTPPASAAGRGALSASAPPSLAGWGEDLFDQLGDGRSGLVNGVDAHSATPIPLQITGRTIVRATTGCDHTVVQTVGNELLSWGDNSAGQLGNGRTGGPGLTTAQRVIVPGSPAIADVQATCHSTTLLTGDGQVLAWGGNAKGELGQGGQPGGFSVLPVPVHLPAGTRVTSIATNGFYTLALTASGDVLAWGESQGELAGRPPATPITTPVPVTFPAGTARITAIAAGDNHALFLTSTGQILAEGNNTAGELGTGKFNAIGNDQHDGSAVPVAVALPAGAAVTAIAAGDEYSLALRSDGTVLAWGEDADGELGDGATLPAKNKAAPVPAAIGVTVAAISAHGDFSLALTRTAQVLAWGTNFDGELGNGTLTAPNSKPDLVKVPDGLAVTGVATGVGTATAFALVRPAGGAA